MNRLVRISAIFLLTAFIPFLLAANNEPKIMLIVKDKSTGLRLFGYTNTTTKLSSKEKKNEPFLYRVDIRLTNYNPLTAMLEIPQSFKNREFPSTNYLEPFITVKSQVVTNTAPPVPVKQNFSGSVLDAGQNPVPNVLVICLDTNGNQTGAFITGLDGKYSFTNIDSGRHRIRIISDRKINTRQVVLKKTPESPQPQARTPVPAVSSNAALKQPEYEPLTTNVLNILSRKDQVLQIMVRKKGGLSGLIPAILCRGRTNFIGPANSLEESPDSCIRTNDTITIDGKHILCGDSHLIRDGVPFDLFFYPVYVDGHKALKPLVMKGFTTIDTIPPAMPVLDSVSSSNGIVSLSWHRVDSENDPLNYRVYAGQDNDLRPLHYFFNACTNSRMSALFTNSDKTFLKQTNLQFSLTAVDQAGNESEFRDLSFDVDQSTNNRKLPDTILDRLNPAFIQKPEVKPPPPDYQVLLANNYIVRPGAVLHIKDKTFDVPRGRSIILMKGSRLVLDNVTLRSPAGSGNWGGIQVQDNSSLVLNNVKISGADTGISLVNGSVLEMKGSVIANCRTAIRSYKGTLRLSSSRILNNRKAASINDSAISMKFSDLVSNSENISISFCSIVLQNCRILDNGSSFTVSGGSGKIESCDIFRNTGDGLTLSGGSMNISGCVISGNRGHGVNCSGSDPVLRNNDILGNALYGVRGGGKITGCFISGNNGSPEIDNTPDNGSDDGKMFSFSNQSIQQIYSADSIRSLRLDKNRK